MKRDNTIQITRIKEKIAFLKEELGYMEQLLDEATGRISKRPLSKSRTFKCPPGHHHEYVEKYDASYCVEHDRWLDGKCNTPGCDRCSNRPARPSQCSWRKKKKKR